MAKFIKVRLFSPVSRSQCSSTIDESVTICCFLTCTLLFDLHWTPNGTEPHGGLILHARNTMCCVML